MPVRLQMLSSGQIDGATLPEPLASAAAAKGSTPIMSTETLGINAGIILAGEDFIKSHSEALNRLYRAYNMAVAYIRDTAEDVYFDKMIEAVGFPPATREVLVLPRYPEAMAPPEEEVAEVLAWLYGKGLTEKEESYKDMVDSSCLP